MTMHRHLAHFDFEAVGETGVTLGDLRRFLPAVDHEHDIAANRFFGFGKWAIDHARSTPARHEPRLQFQRTPIYGFPLRCKAIVPLVPAIDELCAFVGEKMSVRLWAGVSEQQEIGRGGRRCGHRVCGG